MLEQEPTIYGRETRAKTFSEDKIVLMVTIYTAMFCPFCARAKSLLTSKKAAFEEIDVSFNPSLRAEMREKAGGVNSVPQIWVGETHVGGSDDLAALERAGELDALLATAA